MKLFYGWVIVGVGIVVTCIGMGTHDVARRVPAADVAGHGLVARRHLVRRGAQLPRHGLRIVLLGLAVRPVRHARRRADRRRAARHRTDRGEPGDDAAAVPAAVRHPGRAGGGQLLCTDDRDGDALVHRSIAASPWHWSRPAWGWARCSIAPLVALDHHQLRLAQRHADAGRPRLARGHSRLAVGAPAAGAGARWRPRRASGSADTTSPWRRCCARRSSPRSRSRTSRAARRIRARSSTWSAMRSTAASRR